MNRNRYRHRVAILRRKEDTGGSGGYTPEAYEQIGETSCGVRDESETEHAAAESARLAHTVTFTMRDRDIRRDDALVFRGETYMVQRVDRYQHNGREIRVRASITRSRYSVKG